MTRCPDGAGSLPVALHCINIGQARLVRTPSEIQRLLAEVVATGTWAPPGILARYGSPQRRLDQAERLECQNSVAKRRDDMQCEIAASSTGGASEFLTSAVSGPRRKRLAPFAVSSRHHVVVINHPLPRF